MKVRDELSKAILEMLKSIVVGAEDGVDECVVCMEQFENRSKLSRLPCNKKHFFHKDCIDAWL